MLAHLLRLAVPWALAGRVVPPGGDTRVAVEEFGGVGRQGEQPGRRYDFPTTSES